jgi:RimJ/RimL family protein N-acetyltransferase
MSDDVVRFFGLPERVELPDGTVIRHYTDDDIGQLVDVVNASLAHLAPWMPWAQEPATLETQGAWYAESEQSRANGTNYVYGIFAPDGTLLGGTGYHIRNGPGVLEIGYWLAASAVGRGVVTEVSRRLTEVAADVDGVTRVEIHCDEANMRSSAVPKRLGYELVRVDEKLPEAPAETGRHEIWSIDV